MLSNPIILIINGCFLKVKYYEVVMIDNMSPTDRENNQLFLVIRVC